MSRKRMRRVVVGMALVAGAVTAFGSAPASAGRSDAAQMINLNTTAVGTYVSEMLTVGSKIFFISDDNVHGRELFVTDGTVGGTKMVKDITPTDVWQGPEHLTDVNGTVFFTANDGTHGAELWKSDGTEAGTVMVKDVRTGSDGSYPDRLANVNGTLFFIANDGTTGAELWKSDGTAAGTVLVKDIAPSYTGDYPPSVWTDFAVLGSTAYFGADDGTNGVELWKSDGTEAGTVMVQDLFPGSSGSYPTPQVVNGAVWFRIAEPASAWNFHLWKYDGTTLTDVATFPDGGIDNDFYAFDGSNVLFRAFDRVAKNGWELWITDGTGAGTKLVKDINATGEYADSSPSHFTKMGTKVYFTADDGVNGRALWVTDGTTVGTTMVKDIAANTSYYNPKIEYLTVVGSTLYFRANDSPDYQYDDDAPTPRGAVGGNVAATIYGEELWKSDGTTAGTVLVKDINPGFDYKPSDSRIDAGNSRFQVLGTSFYFFADDGQTQQLWTSDGTLAGTTKFADISATNNGSYPTFNGVLGTKALFTAYDGTSGALYATDGTEGGTVRLNEAFTGVVVIGLKGYFGGYDDTTGWGLFETDGTLAGTKLVQDMNPSSMEATMMHMTAAGSKLFFVSDDGTHGTELWVSDGTSAGTKMVKDINPGSDYPGIDGFAVLGSKVYFNANDGTNGGELWVSDGTTGGTSMLKDINPGSNGPSEAPCYGVCWGSPRNLATVGSSVYFSAYGPDTGFELWKTDGTEAGTVLVKDIWTGDDSCGCPVNYPMSSYPSKAYELSGKAYFTANDGSGGAQLWTSDGTAAGTVLVKNINPTGSSFNNIWKVNDRLVFWVDDGTHGNEMWATDGTAAGTVLVKDINPGNGYVYPNDYAVAPTGLYVSLWDGTARSIWFTDGTEAGTTKVVTIQNDARGGMQPYRGGILYTNDNGTDGEELWSYGLPVGDPQTISFSPSTNMKAHDKVALSATATSSLTVTFTASGDCEIMKTGKDAGKLHLKREGKCTVTASQAGNAEWAPADDVVVEITIGKNSVTVAFVGTVRAPLRPVSPFSFGSGYVQLKAQVSPALEGCQVQFTVSPNSATPAGPYTAISDEDGVVLSDPISIAEGTYDFTVTPLGDCEGTPVDAPQVYLGELPATGVDPTVFVWAAVMFLAAGAILVSRQRRRA